MTVRKFSEIIDDRAIILVGVRGSGAKFLANCLGFHPQVQPLVDFDFRDPDSKIRYMLNSMDIMVDSVPGEIGFQLSRRIRDLVIERGQNYFIQVQTAAELTTQMRQHPYARVIFVGNSLEFRVMRALVDDIWDLREQQLEDVLIGHHSINWDSSDFLDQTAFLENYDRILEELELEPLSWESKTKVNYYRQNYLALTLRSPNGLDLGEILH